MTTPDRTTAATPLPAVVPDTASGPHGLGEGSGPLAPRVIGLDLSLTSTGLADAWGQVEVRTFKTKTPAPTLQAAWERLDRLGADIGERINFYGPHPALIVIEGPSYGSTGRGTWDRAGLWWLIVAGLLALQQPVAVVPPTVRARYATGRGNAGKAEVCSAAAHRYGREFATDDEADAFVLAAMGLDQLGHPLAAVPATHRQALEKVAWPEGITS